MDDTPSPEEIKESINIEQGNKKYVLNIKTQGEKMIQKEMEIQFLQTKLLYKK